MSDVPTCKLEHRVNGTWYDVTSRVLWAASSVQLQRGVSDDGSVLIGAGSFVLDNTDGVLTPKSPASTHYPYLVRYRPVRFSMYIDGAWRQRHYGYLSAEPLTFGNAFGTDCRVTWSTIDHMGMASLQALRSVATEATAAKAPLAYWPLTDGESATVPDQSGYNRDGLAPRQLGTEGEIGWSGGTLLPTDSNGVLSLTPTSDTSGYWLANSSGFDLPGSWSLSVWVSPAAKDGYVCQVGDASYSIGIWYDTSTKKLSAIEQSLDSGGDSVDWVLSTTTATITTATIETLTVTPTTVKLGSSSTTGSRHVTDQMFSARVAVGASLVETPSRQRLYSGQVGHLALWSGTVPANTASDILTGPSSMLTLSTAIVQLMAWAGLTVSVTVLGTDRAVQMSKTGGVSAADLVSNLARGSLSRVWAAGDGSITVGSFDYLPTAAVAPSGDVEDDLEWAADPDGQLTEVTTAWPDGTSYTATDPGPYKSQAEIPGVLDYASGASVADWTVRTSDDSPAFRQANYDLLTMPTVSAVALLEPSSLLTIPGLPSQLPASSQTGVVKALTETIGAAEWTLSVALDHDPRSQIFIAGDAVRGVVGAGWLAGPFGAGAVGSWKAGTPIDAAGLNSSGYDGPEARMGTVTFTPTAANTVGTVAVTFPTAFSSAPEGVVVGLVDMSPNQAVLSVGVATTTGFTLYYRRTNTTPTTVYWIAT